MPVRIETSGNISKITLDRPAALNALDVDALGELRACLIDARDQRDVRVIVLTGAGEKAFCVGADLIGTLPPQVQFSESYLLSTEESVKSGLYTRLFDLSELRINKPMIAAVNGYCLGGGLEIALQCDIRVASSNARFGLPECSVASIPAAGGIQYLLRSIPSALAMRMLLTGEHIDAQRAANVGLISDIYPAETLLDMTIGIAERIASNGPLAVQMIKKLARDSNNVPLSEALKMTEMAWGILRDTNDRIEGREAFAEKRKPIFRGQ